jgi:ketosteroid isomerase-like protein
MRTATILAIGACAMARAPSSAHAQATGTDSIAVREAVRQFHDALARGDSGTALSLLAEDAVVLEAGGIESRVEYRTHHLPADIRFAAAVPAKTGPLQVTLVGDVAWVTSISEVTGTFEGRPINSVGAELAVLTRSAQGWQIRAIHWSSRRRAAP